MAQLPILRTTENACAYIALTASLSASLNIGVFTGIDNVDKTAPCVICYAENATEDVPFSGIYHARTMIMVKEMAADTGVSSSLASTMYQTFLSPQTKGALNSYPGYYVYEYFVQDTSERVEGDAWIQTYEFDIISALA